MIEGGKHRIWQISGGPVTRSYSDVFLKYGVGLIGPGDTGVWRQGRDDNEFEGGFVRRFANEVNLNDIFLLRTGMSAICAVGIVASEYLYLNQFDDVNGWDLQHARRIRWCNLPMKFDFGFPVFGANPSRFSRSLNEKAIDYTERFLGSPPTGWQTASLPELPQEEPPLEEIPGNLEDLIAKARDLVSLYWDRQAFGDHPSEDEIVAHFVIPFLRALGWPPERTGVKWRYIDVAVFNVLPRIPENCQFIIEAKQLGAGVEGALEQCKRYINALGVKRDVIITDGIRYRMYSSEDDFAPIAYANLVRLKKSASNLFSKLKRT